LAQLFQSGKNFGPDQNRQLNILLYLLTSD
jgi:hypothetical protein